mgnify:CR=1 FL=1
MENIPKEVLEAARLIDNYFTQQGIATWELHNVCSRNHADQNRVYERYFEFIKEYKNNMNETHNVSATQYLGETERKKKIYQEIKKTIESHQYLEILLYTNSVKLDGTYTLDELKKIIEIYERYK